MYYVYLLRCGDERRLAVHNAGKGAKYTRSRLPVDLVYWENFPNKSSALRRECAIKRLSRAEKLSLIQSFVSQGPSLFPKVRSERPTGGSVLRPARFCEHLC